MSLVGDVILGFREMATDLPQTSAACSISSTSQTTGGTFANQTIYFVATIITPWGETIATPEQNFTITGTGAAVDIGVFLLTLQAQYIRIYYGSASGVEYQYEQFAITGSEPQVCKLTNSPIATQTPPTRSTAYSPDSDGQAVGAFAAYRWLNQALSWAAAKNRGGLPDFGAAGTVNAQPNYVMPGYWKKIDSAWFDGYPLGLLNKTSVFRRQPVPGFSGTLNVFQATDRLMVECWPQPNRTSNQTTLASNIAITDTVANLTSTANQVLGFGLYQIGTEIVQYAAVNGNQLTGLLRGMCGTTPVTQSEGVACTELNLMIAGFRVPSTYSVGQSMSTLYLPPGWDEALISYMLYRFRSAEQDDKAAQRYLQEATQKMSDLSANRIIAGPRQINPYASQGPEVAAGMGSVFGGVIIP